MTKNQTALRMERVLLTLGLLALLSAAGCSWGFGDWDFSDEPGGGGGGTEPCVVSSTSETLTLSLSLLADAGLSGGTCANACIALAHADNAQQLIEAASACSFLPGFARTERDAGPVLLCGSSDSLLRPGPAKAGGDPQVACLVAGDGGEALSADGPCNTLAFSLQRNVLTDGGNCEDACRSLASQGRFEIDDPQNITCSVAESLELPIAAVDGGPAVVCDGQSFATDSVNLGDAGASCQSVCLGIAADGGSFYQATDPFQLPYDCGFVTNSEIYSMDAGTYSAGGPGVTCDWESQVNCPE